MTYQNNLTAASSVAAGDQVQVWQPSAGRWYSAALSTLLTYFSANIAAGTYTTQYAAPSATGFSVSLTARTTDIWLVLTPVAGYAAGTIVLPAATSSYDKQHISVNCTQSVTTLTISANGATAVTGAPTALAANGYFTLRYDAATSTWYRVA